MHLRSANYETRAIVGSQMKACDLGNGEENQAEGQRGEVNGELGGNFQKILTGVTRPTLLLLGDLALVSCGRHMFHTTRRDSSRLHVPLRPVGVAVMDFSWSSSSVREKNKRVKKCLE